jgi:hypothetical protein
LLQPLIQDLAAQSARCHDRSLLQPLIQEILREGDSLHCLEEVLKIRRDQNEVAHELCQIAIRRVRV